MIVNGPERGYLVNDRHGLVNRARIVGGSPRKRIDVSVCIERLDESLRQFHAEMNVFVRLFLTFTLSFGHLNSGSSQSR
jgi:hypothetical protein